MGAKWAIAAAFLILICGRTAVADDVLAGLPADEYWRHQREFAELMPKAMAGDPVAQDRVGAFYDYGFGSGSIGNSNLAAVWYRKAARQGNADAQYNLANLYLNGWGVDEDDQEAKRLFEAAAAQKHPLAELWLGRAYLWGQHGIAADDQLAMKLIHEAAEAGVPEAIGLWAERLPDDDPQKAIWLKKAVRAGSERILLDWDWAHRVGMSSSKLLHKAAELGMMGAPAVYACMVLQGQPSAQVQTDALHWLGVGFDENDGSSFSGLRFLYDAGALVDDPVNRALLQVLSLDMTDAGSRIRPAKAGTGFIESLPPTVRDEVRRRRAMIEARKMLFEDLNVRPALSASPGAWANVCHVLDGL